MRRATSAPGLNLAPALTAHARTAAAGGFVLVTIALTATLGGAYFPETWGWVALGGLVVAAAALLTVEPAEGGAYDALFAGGLLALCAWTALSASWSDSVPRSVSELERDLVYVAGVGAVLAAGRRRSLEPLLAGLLAATTAVCLYSLATKLLPGLFGYASPADYRLARPLGYSNAIALVASLATLLALGFASGGRSRPVRSLAAALVPALVTTLYLTFGRGAWIALVAGLATALAASRERLRLAAQILALGAVSAAGVWLAARSGALTTPGPPHPQVAHEGRLLALALAGLAAAAAAAAPALERVPATLGRGRPRQALVLAGVAVAAAALILLVRAGGPTAVAGRAYRSFTRSNGALLTRDRVLIFSSAGRSDYWRVAAHEYGQHPWLGSGAGTFDLYWHRHRPYEFGALDAHSLYLETLAELGPFGLLLLLAALAAPLAAAAQARRTPLVPAAAGGYVAFLVHAGVDWDWELPTVTLVGLFCGAALVVAGRAQHADTRPGRAWRTPALAVVAALCACAVVAELGNSALRQSQAALERRDYARADQNARTAERWAPWSSEARLLLAAAQTAEGARAAAVQSIETAVRKDPRDWQAWYALAVATTGAKRARALARAAQLNPRSSEVAALRGSSAR